MANLTRDPFHPIKSTYITNMGTLTIYVDGKLVDSQYVVNVYKTAHGREPYVQVFKTDNGKIVEEQGPTGQIRPVMEDIEGQIQVIGKPKHCGCWKGKKIQHWWRQLHSHGKRSW